MAEENKTFHWADYLVFSISLAVSLVIGFIFMCKQKSSRDYLVASGGINPLAVGLSLTASILNAVFIIGGPAEIYYYGVTYCLLAVSFLITGVISAELFIPIYRNLDAISAYEYLEKRYGTMAPRIGGSLVFCLQIIFFLSVVLYAPALAFQQVTGLPLDVVLAVCGGVCTLYVVVGGIKAVIWTDTIQMVIVLAGLLALVIEGTLNVEGGGWAVWEKAKAGGRINFDVVDPDPRVRHSIWTQCFGNVFIWTSLFGSNQMMIQRFHAVGTTFQAKLALYVAIVFTLIVTMLVVLLGLVMYAYYNGPGGCDPLIGGLVSKGDQLVPYFLMDTLGSFHGLPGLFAAAVFAAALSSVSSAVNSLAAVFLEDFIKPIHKACTKGKSKLSDRHCSWISKGLSLFFGLLTIALSYIARFMGANLITIPTSIWAVVASPVFGMFVLALFFPCSNGWGALIGMIFSLVINLWGWISGVIYAPPAPVLMPLAFNCSKLNIPQPGPTNYPPAIEFYKMSYVWYGLLGLVNCIVVGLLAGFVIDGIAYSCRSRSRNVKPSLVFSCADRCCCCCPSGVKECVRCGVPEDEEDDEPVTNMDKIGNGHDNGLRNPAFMDESATAM